MTMTPQYATAEADRCLSCFDAPCREACPTHIDIPTFIAMIKSRNVRGAAEVVKSSNALANVCGKICPEEVFCQASCTRAKQDSPIAIRELHFFATQHEARAGYSRRLPAPSPDATAAVIGAGPAGLACAFELSKLGVAVTLFDGRAAGGVPRHSIPTFRLAERELLDDLDFLAGAFTLRAENVTPAVFSGIRKEFDAVFLGVGLGLDRAIGLRGEDLAGVHPVLRFLEAAKLGTMRVGRRVLIVGGGNVSLDAAATAKRLGAEEVTLLYRRSEAEMKVWKSELEEARRQGVEIRFLTVPVRITGEKAVTGLVCRRTALSAERDASGRPVPVEVPGSEFTLPAECLVVAVGQVVGTEIARGLASDHKGYIAVDAELRTSDPKVFAGGDAVGGEGTIVGSVAHGKRAARAMRAHIDAVRGAARPPSSTSNEGRA
jgi:glutamate synthase (NADPH/NADH) small chain